MKLFLAIFVGASLTVFIRLFFSFNPVVASAIVGFLGSALALVVADNSKVSSYIAAIYCGSFIGMSQLVYPHYLYLVCFCSLIAAVILYYSKNRAVGFGGKLGTIAFLSVFLFYLVGLQHLPFKSAVFDLTSQSFLHVLLLLLSCWIGIEATLWSCLFFSKSSTWASSISTILFVLLIFILGINVSIPTYKMSAVFFGGSFIAMANPRLLPVWPIRFLMAVLYVFLYLLSTIYVDPYGGTLGTLAFLTFVVFYSFKQRDLAVE